MCGLIGMNGRNEELIRHAAGLISYRGPDYTGVYVDDQVTLGHNRLAILDLDPRSNQPMCDDTQRIYTIFNGEIYNFKEIRKKLEHKYHFRTTSDTEVLMYAYREYGKDMASHLHGMYAFVVYDLDKQKIFIFRDHAGIKPLYYFHINGVFAFGSELKGLLDIAQQKKISLNLDQKAIDTYLVFGYVPSPSTLYKGVYKLEASSCLEFDIKENSIISIEKFTPAVKPVSTEAEFEQVIKDKILTHLIADVPVGVFFSGGTDSSLIASVLHEAGVDLETFSIRMEGKQEDEKHFTEISKHLKLKSNVYDFTIKEFDEVYYEVMNLMDDPIFDSSLFPTYFVSKKAAEKVKVVLSGEGGDEFFYGYQRDFVLSRLNSKSDYELDLIDKVYFALPSFKAKNKLFEKVCAFFGKPFSYYLVGMSTSRDAAGVERWKLSKDEFKNRKLKPLDIDKKLYLENVLLRKTDAATSYVSIEGRVPLLDPAIIGNAHQFESSYLAGGILKSFLKKMLARYIPEHLVYRGKSGFGMNMITKFKKSQYLRGDLTRAVEYLNAKKLLNMDIQNNYDYYIAKYPNFCFSLITLYYSLKNAIPINSESL